MIADASWLADVRAGQSALKIRVACQTRAGNRDIARNLHTTGAVREHGRKQNPVVHEAVERVLRKLPIGRRRFSLLQFVQEPAIFPVDGHQRDELPPLRDVRLHHVLPALRHRAEPRVDLLAQDLAPEAVPGREHRAEQHGDDRRDHQRQLQVQRSLRAGPPCGGGAFTKIVSANRT